MLWFKQETKLGILQSKPDDKECGKGTAPYASQGRLRPQSHSLLGSWSQLLRGAYMYRRFLPCSWTWLVLPLPYPRASTRCWFESPPNLSNLQCCVLIDNRGELMHERQSSRSKSTTSQQYNWSHHDNLPRHQTPPLYTAVITISDKEELVHERQSWSKSTTSQPYLSWTTITWKRIDLRCKYPRAWNHCQFEPPNQPIIHSCDHNHRQRRIVHERQKRNKSTTSQQYLSWTITWKRTKLRWKYPRASKRCWFEPSNLPILQCCADNYRQGRVEAWETKQKQVNNQPAGAVENHHMKTYQVALSYRKRKIMEETDTANSKFVAPAGFKSKSKPQLCIDQYF